MGLTPQGARVRQGEHTDELGSLSRALLWHRDAGGPPERRVARLTIDFGQRPVTRFHASRTASLTFSHVP